MSLDSTKSETEIFLKGLTQAISLAQLFGVMPVEGLSSKSSTGIIFKWKSKRTFISCIFLLLNLAAVILNSIHFSHIGFTAQNTSGLMFYATNFMAYLLFLCLARKWPSIVEHWFNKDKQFWKWRFPQECRIGNKQQAVSVAIAVLAIVEHLMYEASEMYGFYMMWKSCNFTQKDPVEAYYKIHFPGIFHILPYNHGIMAVMQVLNIASTFMWNFMDLFIILVTMSLASQFKELNDHLQTEVKSMSNQTEKFFREIRLDFLTLLDLLSYVDKELSFIILLSCLNNIYFVCYQLMNIFNTLRYFINYAYFWYSLLYLIGRISFLFITAASINETAMMPARILRNVPSHVWCEEANRFLVQLYSETIGLTAMGFFHFTRKLILHMAGTIMTFEMIILQVNQNSVDFGLPPLCS